MLKWYEILFSQVLNLSGELSAFPGVFKFIVLETKSHFTVDFVSDFGKIFGIFECYET
jgi:hypothetical protein